MEYSFRHPKITDLPFVAETWFKSMRFAPEFKAWEDAEYYPWAKDHVYELLQNCECILVHHPDDEDTILGYIVFTGQVMHWAYVRKDWRKENVFRSAKERIGITRIDHCGSGFSPSRARLAYRPWFVGGHSV